MLTLSNSLRSSNGPVGTRENHDLEHLRIRRLTSWRELESLRPVWEQILQVTPGLTIFSTVEWLSAWWKAFGQGKQLIALTFSDAAGEVVGLAPLYIEQMKGGTLGRLKRLLMVGDGTRDSDALDLIFRSGYEEACSRALLAWLDSDRSWDVCELNTLPEASDNARALQSSLTKRHWVSVRSARPHSVVLLPDSWDAYLRQLSKKFVYKIERGTHKLARRFTVRVVKCTETSELSACLETLFALHQRRWNAKGQSGTFASIERRELYYQMSRAFLLRGWLEFWHLELNGTTVAVQFGFRRDNTLYSLQEGLNPAHLSDWVGVVLRAHILQRMIEDGVSRYDFLGGIDPHKQLWGATLGAYTDLHFARPMSRGAAYLVTRQRLNDTKAWLRTHLSDSALDVVRRMRRRTAAV
jgi:CelD/BcsL family acetyltransferase involved in cellulose biosynthesis